MNGPFGTILDAIADATAAPSAKLSTGLPQLDRVAPLWPGHLAVLIGTSGVGKSRVAAHITSTVNCTHSRGVLTISASTTLDALDATLAVRPRGLVVIDPLTALANADPRWDMLSGSLDDIPSDEEPPDFDPADADADAGSPSEAYQRPVHPAVLGEIAENLRALADRHQVPVLVCYRHAPIRDAATDRILSTESVNPLLDVADVAIVVRVLADPRTIGLEIIRNGNGPMPTLRMPLTPEHQPPRRPQ